MSEIVGKWIQPEGQPYQGLWFNFSDDGTFTAEYPSMGIASSGTYKVTGNKIEIDQAEHTLGLIGSFVGIFQINGNHLKMALSSGPGQPAPKNMDEARVYINESSTLGE